MKGKLLRTLLVLAALLGAGSLLVLAAYTTNGRELISLGFLEKNFFQTAVSTGESTLEEHEDALYEGAKEQLDALTDRYDSQLSPLDGSFQHSSALNGLRYKRGDALTVATGSSLLLLAGEATLTFSNGAVVDTMAGQEVKSETALQQNHRYLVAERTTATVTIASDTAVLSLDGSYSLTPSSAADYNMLADAMRAMGLFKGSDTGYGSGYDLEKAPTRIQGLIMFLRLLGEEQAALSSSAPCPFSDVPAWSQRYVAYAYEQGYTKGVSAAEFGPGLELRAMEYMTFVLRALGYTDSGETADFAWDTSLAKSLQLGVLTAREHKQLTEQPFLRAQVVYVSYYALDATLKSTGESLYTALSATGALDKAAVDAARSSVTSIRMR